MHRSRESVLNQLDDHCSRLGDRWRRIMEHESMRKRVIRRKPLVVDGQRYEASVTATYHDGVQLHVTIRADFGTRSCVLLNGLHNFDYYHDYGYWSAKDYSETAHSIEITPRMLAVLIRFARNNGWSPESEKSNRRLEITNIDAKSLLIEYNGSASDDHLT